MQISVIVPAFNEENYLTRLLGSLRQASLVFTDLNSGEMPEVTVVDNGSTDRTAIVAQGFGAEVVTEPRRSIAVARNAGARNSKGDVLVFIDADYRVLPSFFVRIADGYDSNRAMTAAGVRVLLEPSEVDPITQALSYIGLMLLRRIKNMSFGVATFRRECFETLGGFAEDHYAFEDVDILERLAAEKDRDRGQYRILTDVTVFASARGFHRGGALGMGRMLGTYARLAIDPSARYDPSKCGYWYERD